MMIHILQSKGNFLPFS